jgi:hypothetical protein
MSSELTVSACQYKLTVSACQYKLNFIFGDAVKSKRTVFCQDNSWPLNTVPTEQGH